MTWRFLFLLACAIAATGCRSQVNVAIGANAPATIEDTAAPVHKEFEISPEIPLSIF